MASTSAHGYTTRPSSNESAFRSTFIANATPSSGSRRHTPAPVASSLSLASSAGDASPARRAVRKHDPLARARDNMNGVLNEEPRGAGPGSRAPYRLVQPTGGEDSVYLGGDNVAYECGVKEAQMRTVTDAAVVAHALASPSAGARLPVRDITGSRMHARVGGIDSVEMALITSGGGGDGAGGGGSATPTETIQEAQRRVAFDPAARAAMDALPVAGSRPSSAAGERGLRVSQPVGGRTTAAVRWSAEPPPVGVSTSATLASATAATRSSRTGGSAGGSAESSAPQFPQQRAVRPRDRAGDIISQGGHASSAGGASTSPSSAQGGSATEAAASAATRGSAAAAFNARRAQLLASQLVGGMSAAFLSGGAAAVGDARRVVALPEAGIASTAAAASTPASAGGGSADSAAAILRAGAPPSLSGGQRGAESSETSAGVGIASRIRRPQPVGGRTLLEAAGVHGVDAPHPLVGGRRTATEGGAVHTKSSLILG